MTSKPKTKRAIYKKELEAEIETIEQRYQAKRQRIAQYMQLIKKEEAEALTIRGEHKALKKLLSKLTK